jgi:hypothetical protein
MCSDENVGSWVDSVLRARKYIQPGSKWWMSLVGNECVSHSTKGVYSWSHTIHTHERVTMTAMVHTSTTVGMTSMYTHPRMPEFTSSSSSCVLYSTLSIFLDFVGHGNIQVCFGEMWVLFF